jgi:hypothetical protein
VPHIEGFEIDAFWEIIDFRIVIISELFCGLHKLFHCYTQEMDGGRKIELRHKLLSDPS